MTSDKTSAFLFEWFAQYFNKPNFLFGGLEVSTVLLFIHAVSGSPMSPYHQVHGEDCTREHTPVYHRPRRRPLVDSGAGVSRMEAWKFPFIRLQCQSMLVQTNIGFGAPFLEVGVPSGIADSNIGNARRYAECVMRIFRRPCAGITKYLTNK